MGGGDSAPEQAEVVTRPPEAWAVRVELLRASLAGFYAEVAMLPSIQRVRYLAELGRALDGEHRVLLERAMVAARGDGWGLRRIAAAAGLSHEQVRRVLAGADQPR